MALGSGRSYALTPGAPDRSRQSLVVLALLDDRIRCIGPEPVIMAAGGLNGTGI